MELLSISQGMIYWTIIVFVLLLIILKKFAWGPILSAIDEREQKIASSIQKAENAQMEAEALLNQHKSLISSTEQKAAEIIKEARHKAEEIAEQIKITAQSEAKLLLEKAKTDIQSEKEAALKELKLEIANLALSAAEKILKQSLDTEKNKKFIDSYLQ